MPKGESTSTEVTEVVNPATGEIIPVKEWARVIPMSAGADMSDAIVDRIMAVDSLEALLAPQEEGEGLRDFIGQPIVIHDARAGASSFKEGPGIFVILDIELTKTGEHKVVTTGATNVVAQIAKAVGGGWLPFACKVVETQSKSNPERKIQWLVAAEAF